MRARPVLRAAIPSRNWPPQGFIDIYDILESPQFRGIAVGKYSVYRRGGSGLIVELQTRPEAEFVILRLAPDTEAINNI